MPLQPGARLGPYEILSLAGVGGMGEVYKARDTRLDRTVAIKILSDTLAADPQFRERFDREARTISQLDHPHICALHDVGEHDGTAFLVMPYLDGETLADRLAKGALPIDQALRTAIEIASALDRAHRAGIVHRDLKPGNIMLTKAGARLLDFGLAKSSPSVVAGVRPVGAPRRRRISPRRERFSAPFNTWRRSRLRAREADARTDIFAFGVVLYEMVTGTKAFTGKTHASLISSILKDAPRPISELQPLTPPLLDHIVSRCLAKDPDERWQSASDLTRELRWISESGASARPAASPVARAGALRPLLAGSAAWRSRVSSSGIAATMLLVRFGEPAIQRTVPDVARAAREHRPGRTPAGASTADRTLTEGRPSRTAMVWSPDGRSIVFSAVQGDRQQLYVRALDQLSATAMAGTEGAASPFFSPDGRWVGFWSGGRAEEDSARWRGASDDDLRNNQRLRRELGIG